MSTKPLSCLIHHVPLKREVRYMCPACKGVAGAKGGRSTSPAKLAALGKSRKKLAAQRRETT